MKYIVLSLLISACSSAPTTTEITSSDTTVGAIERLDPQIDSLIAPDAQLEILGEGFEWTEGPVWIASGDYLLFSDVPQNTVFRWSARDSITQYLSPSGFAAGNSDSKEPGSNGLYLDGEGHLVLCQHGARQVARMDAPLDDPQPSFVALADNYDGKRLNSPNDLVFDRAGNIYFTDPPYGLPGGADSEEKELDFQGVYRWSAADSSLTLLTQALSRPNGIALSPDEQTLYVANSDSENAVWMRYPLDEDGTIGRGSILYDATEATADAKGLPDGLVVNRQGHLFATGPGGVWVFAPDGTHLGTIQTGEATANCTLNADESVLYITADMYLMRLKMR